MRTKTFLRQFLQFPLALAAFGKDATSGPKNASEADPPPSEHLDELCVHWAFNTGGGESWNYTLSKEGIIQQGHSPSHNPGDTMEPLITGGVTQYFHGAAPGDVLLTFTTKSRETDQVVDTAVYAIRVYDDLKLAVLREKRNSNR